MCEIFKCYFVIKIFFFKTSFLIEKFRKETLNFNQLENKQLKRFICESKRKFWFLFFFNDLSVVSSFSNLNEF